MSGPASRGTRRLTREEVARTALELVDDEGLDALSMRRLAAALAVPTMTLYGTVRSKRELLDAVVDAAAADFRPVAADGAFREDLAAHLEAVRAWLARHPAVVRLRGEEPLLRPAAFRISEPAVRLLLDAGFPPIEAARAFRLLFTYVFGAALGGPDEPSDEQRRAVRAAVAGLPPEEFPALAAIAEEASAALGGAEQFAYGLARVLDGLEARLRELGR